MPFPPEIALIPIFDKQIRWSLKTKQNATTFIVCQNKPKIYDILKYTTPLIDITVKVVSPKQFLTMETEDEIFSVVVIDDGIDQIEQIS